jgi:hypothetical protein
MGMGTNAGPGIQHRTGANIVSNSTELISLAQQIARQDRETWRRENNGKQIVLPDFVYHDFEQKRYIHLLEEIVKGEYDESNLLFFKRLNDKRLSELRAAPETNTKQEQIA